MTKIVHRELAAGRWGQLSLIEQLANVGSEVGRMLRWRHRDQRLTAAAFERALELLDLTLTDPRWRERLREIARARELLCAAAAGGTDYGTTLEDLDRYFLAFAVAAKSRRDPGKVEERSIAGQIDPTPGRLSLGSWAFFCDLSGHVQERFDNPIVTTAAIAVPQELLSALRTQVGDAFPGNDTKWKYGKLDGFRTARELIVGHQLPFAVSVTFIADPTKWQSYFANGKDFCAKAAALSGESLVFATPDLTLRMRFLAKAIAALVGRVLRTRQSGRSELATVEIEVIVDTDLRNAETEAQFCESFHEWPLTSRLVSELGIQPIVRGVRCETEQAEPLLLLPDYLAGVYHHADPRTRLRKPVVTPEEASMAVRELRAVCGGFLYEQSEDFDDLYPLDHDGDGGVILRAGNEKQ